jgi:hypothetical protein
MNIIGWLAAAFIRPSHLDDLPPRVEDVGVESGARPPSQPPTPQLPGRPLREQADAIALVAFTYLLKATSTGMPGLSLPSLLSMVSCTA